jgi:hypothetical protein
VGQVNESNTEFVLKLATVIIASVFTVLLGFGVSELNQIRANLSSVTTVSIENARQLAVIKQNVDNLASFSQRERDRLDGEIKRLRTELERTKR